MVINGIKIDNFELYEIIHFIIFEALTSILLLLNKSFTISIFSNSIAMNSAVLLKKSKKKILLKYIYF